MIAWLALAAALVALLLWLVFLLLVVRFWRQVEPQVKPLLAMFMPPAQAGEMKGDEMLADGMLGLKPPE